MEKVKIEFEHHPIPEGYSKGEDWSEWIAYIPTMKGMAESGKTKEGAFAELMKSLIVKIMYDNEISTSDTLIWTWAKAAPQNYNK